MKNQFELANVFNSIKWKDEIEIHEENIIKMIDTEEEVHNDDPLLMDKVDFNLIHDETIEINKDVRFVSKEKVVDLSSALVLKNNQVDKNIKGKGITKISQNKIVSKDKLDFTQQTLKCRVIRVYLPKDKAVNKNNGCDSYPIEEDRLLPISSNNTPEQKALNTRGKKHNQKVESKITNIDKLSTVNRCSKQSRKVYTNNRLKAKQQSAGTNKAKIYDKENRELKKNPKKPIEDAFFLPVLEDAVRDKYLIDSHDDIIGFNDIEILTAPVLQLSEVRDRHNFLKNVVKIHNKKYYVLVQRISAQKKDNSKYIKIVKNINVQPKHKITPNKIISKDKDSAQQTLKPKDGAVANNNEVRKFTCPVCLEQFNFQSGLVNHWQRVQLLICYLCNKCGIYFKQKDNNAPLFPLGDLHCRVCYANVSKLKSLKSHICFHKIDAKFVENDESLKVHPCHPNSLCVDKIYIQGIKEDTNIKPKEKVFTKCDICGLTYSHKVHQYYCRIRKQKSDGLPPDSIEDDGNSKKRIRKKKQPRSPSLCDICGASVINLYHHRFSRHQINNMHQRRNKCPVCGKNYRDVNSHMVKVHCEMRPHKCPTCGKAFKIKFHLRVHLRSHEKVKPFKCFLCLRTFTTKQWRDKHLNSHNK